MGVKSSKMSKFIIGAQGVKRLMSSSSPRLMTPRGYFPIQVGICGETTSRFVVHRAALGDADFLELLHKSAEEYGFCNEGVLRIPYEPRAFEEWMISKVKSNRKVFRVKPIW